MQEEDLRRLWEARAKEKGKACEGVLFKGLSKPLNVHLHEWHKEIVINRFLSRLPRNASIVDVGCGYGRITKLIEQARPDIQVIGMDFSFFYCVQYIEGGRPAICADLVHLPLVKGTFDGLIAVTTLMYVPARSREHIVKNLADLLRPGGLALFIDPGEEVSKIARRVKPSSRLRTTGGTGFLLSEYDHIANNESWTCMSAGGNLGFSLLLPFVILTSRFGRINDVLLAVARCLDRWLYRWRRFGLHRWMVLRRQD